MKPHTCHGVIVSSMDPRCPACKAKDAAGAASIVPAHEEDWSVFFSYGGQTYVQYGPGNEFVCGALMNPHRAKLAAAAPEMARMLLDLEWEWSSRTTEGENEGAFVPTCMSCLGKMDDGGHKSDCALDALLKKAGVR